MTLMNHSLLGLRTSWAPLSILTKSVLLVALVLVGIQAPVFSQQVRYTKPAFRFGVAAGANVNFYRGTTQVLNSDFTSPVAFHLGQGVGLFAAPLIEYHDPDYRLGVMLQAGFDGRSGKFDEQYSQICNCPADVSADLSYFTIEPSLRIAPFKGNFYLFGGPRFAFNIANSFTFEEYVNPDFPGELPDPNIEGDFSEMDDVVSGMQIGAGYDIPITSQNMRTQAWLSPFVSYHPDFGAKPRNIETWNINSLRAGIALKMGFGREIPANAMVPDAMSNVRFSVNSPKNITGERHVREMFPLRNYVFFDLGSTEIPERYVTLNKGQVKDFKEDQLELHTPNNLSGRSDRQMTVYYNVLNILGDRMYKNPTSTITLVGSSEKGPEDGQMMAESIQEYLVDAFMIDASRIAVEGRDKPKIPSEQPGATLELDLLRAGDRRVTIESTAPELLMEFQEGTGASLKPVQIRALQTAPLDSYVTFNNAGARKELNSWTVEVKDEQGKVQYFGPYTQDRVSMPGNAILGTRPSANYQVTMVGQTKTGKTIRETTPVHMVLWKPSGDVEALRYSVLYEFDDANTITRYEKYISNVITPKIPEGATVIIHGYTDVVGEEQYNETLSLARANDVKKIIVNSLSKAGRSDVKFAVYGFGEDQNLSLFNNKLPEERFYNRTVVIDIIPK